MDGALLALIHMNEEWTDHQECLDSLRGQKQPANSRSGRVPSVASWAQAYLQSRCLYQ